MIELDVTTDNQSGIAGMISGLTSQLPYAYSVAINNTLNSAQSAIQAKLAGEFTLRRADFIQRTIYIAPSDRATKNNLVGTVRVNPARDMLAKFEDGGMKTPQASSTLAVPIFRADDKNIIIKPGDALSVKRLMDSIKNRSGNVLRARVRKGMLHVAADPNKVFLVTTPNGTFILQRMGPGAGNNRVLYAFKKSVPLPASLHFDETAMSAALASWDTNFNAALDRAIETMR